MIYYKERSEKIDLENYIFNKVKDELELWGNNEDKNDIYVISFLISHDDYELPTLTVDYNTLRNWKEKKKDYSGSEMEVKWNYSFWLQEYNLILFDEDDFEGVKLRDKFLKFCFFRDNKNTKIKTNTSFNKLVEKREVQNWLSKEYDRFRDYFIDVCISVSNKIHQDEILTKIFGRNLPIILNELSDYEKFLEWNKRANLNGEASELISTWNN
jgi:hypothetical protein